MTTKSLLILCGLLCLAASPAPADTFMGSPAGSWRNLPTLNESPAPFWDNPSMDGAHRNIGFILQGLSIPKLQYWSVAKKVDNNVVFGGQGGGQTETLLITVAGNAGTNQLYAYDTAQPSHRTLLFSGLSAPPATTVTIDIPYSQYGFLLTGAGGTFFSGNGQDAKSSDKNSNFAFFQSLTEPGVWYFGVEDLQDQTGNGKTGKEGVGDYNDMVVRISSASFHPAPLPSTALLLASGLVGLVLWRKQRRHSG